MPYYVHVIGASESDLHASQSWEDSWHAPADSTIIRAVFGSPAEAHLAKKELVAKGDLLLTVTFVATHNEQERWRARESAKIRGYSACHPVPWHGHSWYQDSQVGPLDRAPSLASMHYAYLSALRPGLVAYTPSEEFGVADRQLAIRPGKYLEQFAPHLTSIERDGYVARCKAIDAANVVQFAITPEEIVRVYRNGPSSCMSHGLTEYESGDVHPVEVYGDSDLQVAYLDDGSRIRARVVIWPKAKIYSRVYGDLTLQHLLEAQGYSHGSLDGACVRAIRLRRECYVMPYIDGIETATLRKTAQGPMFRLNADTDGTFKTQETCGTTRPNDDDADEDESSVCAHCDTQIPYNDTYCEECDNSRYTCMRCDDEFFTDDPFSVEDYGVMCGPCYRRHSRECEECGERFVEDRYSSRERLTRTNESVTAFCLDCGSDVIIARNEDKDGEIR